MSVHHVWLPALAALVLASTGANAACDASKTRNCVNLDAIPAISTDIVGAEEKAHQAQRQRYSQNQDDTKPYTGPMLGISTTPRKVPTVGYRWSLD
ncbi:MAG: hypothetical protein JO267_15850 [Alphaproteobacteria bacterium]|nr:hypothetical protein [Alphaproteobacteria bacterium]